MIDTIKNLSSITTVPKFSLEKLINTEIDILCHEVLQGLSESSIIECDIGIGSIIFSIDQDQIEYKFIPSSKFETRLIDCINNNESPLIKRTEELIKQKISSAYKELL